MVEVTDDGPDALPAGRTGFGHAEAGLASGSASVTGAAAALVMAVS
jgi:hypothetical protein